MVRPSVRGMVVDGLTWGYLVPSRCSAVRAVWLSVGDEHDVDRKAVLAVSAEPSGLHLRMVVPEGTLGL
jgi:hypothetical protein